MNECPELRVLNMVRWQLFGSLTFKSAGLSDRVRDTMFMAFVREVENAARVPQHRLLWCCRREHGELGKRLHFHALIGGFPSERLHIGSCFQLMRIWERVGGGHARWRLFNSDTERPEAALNYTLKGLAGDDFYETSKFNRAQLTLSESTVGMVTRLLKRDRSFSTGEKCVPASAFPVDTTSDSRLKSGMSTTVGAIAR